MFLSLPIFAQRVVVVHSVWSSPGSISIMNASPPFTLRNGIEPHGSTLNKVLYSSGYLYTVSSGNGKIYILQDDNHPFLVDSITLNPSSNPYSAVINNNKILISLWASDSVVLYDLTTKGMVWGLRVWRSPQYVGFNGGYFYAISTGYRRDSFRTDTSTLYKIDTLGNIVDSLKFGINLLSMEFYGTDTAFVSGGDWFDATTQRIYLISTNPLTVLDSIPTPQNIGFLKYVNTDTLLALGYSFAGYFIPSSRAFIPLPLGSYYGFSEGEVYNERIFILAAGDYTSNGNIIVFNRNTNSIEHTATVDVGPISITLSPNTLSSKEYVYKSPENIKAVYDITGRRVVKPASVGVYFVVGDNGRVKKVIKR